MTQKLVIHDPMNGKLMENIKIDRFITSCYKIFSILFIYLNTSALAESPTNPVILPDQFPECPVQFVRALAVSQDGSIWAVGESAGIHCLKTTPSGYDSCWTDMKYTEGLTPANAYTAVVEDLQHRIWVGTDNRGIFIFNGEKWKNYQMDAGPSGNHIFSIAVSPRTGDVAIASSGGITLYQQQTDSWTNLPGIPSFKTGLVESLCFSPTGSLWLAYACGGIAVSTPKDHFQSWKTYQAPWYWDSAQNIREPLAPEGEGLSSNLCNAIASLPDETVAVGTCSGLNIKKKNKSWQFLRGKDYASKNSGIFLFDQPNKKIKNKAKSDLLPEDYVSALTVYRNHLLVGFRNAGAVLFNASTGRLQQTFPECKAITCLSTIGDSCILAGTYGHGVKILLKRDHVNLPPPSTLPRQFPSPAKPLHQDQLDALFRSLCKTAQTQQVEPVSFYGDDWATQGDWCCSKGKDYAMLCAANAPAGNVEYPTYLSQYDYQCAGVMGPNKTRKDALRHWVEEINRFEDRNVLVSPDFCIRTEAEWDDHGEAYPLSMDGPDIWVVVKIPPGRYMIDLYFYNPNGRQGKNNWMRDYVVEARKASFPKTGDTILGNIKLPSVPWTHQLQTDLISQQIKSPVLARCRVRHVAGTGVYKSFMVSSGGTYYFRICRNHSFNTILNGIFITNLNTHRKNEKGWNSDVTMPYLMGHIPGHIKDYMDRPVPFLSYRDAALFSCKQSALHYRQWMLECLRYQQNVPALADKPELQLLHLALYFKGDQWEAQFDQFLTNVWSTFQKASPFTRSSQWAKYSPNTVPLSPKELMKMEKLGIDWKEYLPGATPSLPLEELKKKLKTTNNQTD